jgi:hypothetical protein
MTRYWRTGHGDRIEDDDWIDPAGRSGVVLTAWADDGYRALTVERGPLVGWLWDEGGSTPVTVLFGHDEDNSFYGSNIGWGVLLPDGRVLAGPSVTLTPGGGLRDCDTGRFTSQYATRYWRDEAEWTRDRDRWRAGHERHVTLGMTMTEWIVAGRP